MRSDPVPIDPAGGEPMVVARGLGKAYPLFERPLDRVRHALFGRAHRRYREFNALRAVDFSVNRGETFGIVGRNGSGKSTLLQLIAGTLVPSAGEVRVRGRIAALLELGSGFHPEFSGRENVVLNGMLLGLSRAEVLDRLDAIVRFAEIGDFIDQPVKTYSSGMQMRLAFSVLAHVDADVLIIDEALAVGDAFFMQRCMQFLRRYQRHGTLLFVSHDGSAVSALCDRAMWLEGGAVKALGPAREVMHAYLDTLGSADGGPRERVVASANGVEKLRPVAPKDPRAEWQLRAPLRNELTVAPFDIEQRALGVGGIEALAVTLAGDDGAPRALIAGGETVTLAVHAVAHTGLISAIVGFYVRGPNGDIVFGDNTCLTSALDPLALEPGEAFVARFTFEMPRLPHGRYAVTLGLADGGQSFHAMHAWLDDALVFDSAPALPVFGALGIPMQRIELARR